MSHLEIPDGIIPFFWLITGMALCGLILAFCIYRIRGQDLTRVIPRLGLMSAFTLAAMSVPLGFLPYHLNLTVLVGIVLGPWLGFISVFIVNLLLSLMGHGGITVVGLNTVQVGAQVFLGYYLFKGLTRIIRQTSAAAVTTFTTILLSTILMVGIIGISQVDPVMFLEHEEQAAESVHQNETGIPADSIDADEGISLKRFASIVFPVTIPGALLEAAAVAFIIRFLARTRPDMIYSEIKK